jgi:hypothetical protein
MPVGLTNNVAEKIEKDHERQALAAHDGDFEQV